ncbi:MAG TPA: glycoside hydrolase [Sulfurimonas sp.]|nr:glycoside hydrolase [Sulfurimonas sp.]
MKAFYLIGVILIILGLQGCVKNPSGPKLSFQDSSLRDLKLFPQNISAYLSNFEEREVLLGVQENYDKKYFAPWNYTKTPMSKSKIMWPYSSYTYDKSFGENLKPLDKKWFIDMKNKGNYDEYGCLNAKAISLSYLDLRNFPTHKPVFKDPSQAGEGFPFDYMQNSGVHANEPLFVSHLSTDGKWAYVFTAYAAGWVDKKGIVFLDEKVIKSWQDARQIELIDEFYSVKDINNNFVFRSRVGMRLALVSVKKDYYIALAITGGKDNTPIYKKVKIPFAVAKEGKLILNAKNMEYIVKLMLKSHYSWGGLYEERDCSSTLRDLYAPFGIWLPRNSSEQSKIGKVISLKNLSIEEKKKTIIDKAIPFETLLYKKGHILLYLGVYKGEITVLHNVWGIKTMHNGVEGRNIIGRTIISSLELGKESEGYNPDKAILARLSSMNILTQ